MGTSAARDAGHRRAEALPGHSLPDPWLIPQWRTDEILRDRFEALLGLSSAMHAHNFRPTTGSAPAIHQLDITYRDGPLAMDEQRGELRPAIARRTASCPMAPGCSTCFAART
ncbi:MAG TPA: hypothetical protein VGD48_11595 [Kutzneria sp.]